VELRRSPWTASCTWGRNQEPVTQDGAVERRRSCYSVHQRIDGIQSRASNCASLPVFAGTAHWIPWLRWRQSNRGCQGRSPCGM